MEDAGKARGRFEYFKADWSPDSPLALPSSRGHSLRLAEDSLCASRAQVPWVAGCGLLAVWVVLQKITHLAVPCKVASE